MATPTNQERTILNELTTVFTPPPHCTTAVGLGTKNNVAWWGQTCSPNGARDYTGCWPATRGGGEDMGGKDLSGWGFYSPGLSCPLGYRTACTAVAGGKSQWHVQFQMEPEETFVGCCPTGFTCWNLNGQTCISHVTKTSIETFSCQSGSTVNPGFTTIPNEFVTSTNFFAPMIQLAFKQSDLPESLRTTSSSSSSSTTSSSSPTSSSTGASSSSSSSLSSSSSSSSSRESSERSSTQPTTSPVSSTSDSVAIGAGHDSSSPASSESATTNDAGLSTGAIAGIAVGAAIFVLLIVAAAVFVWRRRRKDLQGTGGRSELDGMSAVPPPSTTGPSGTLVGGMSEGSQAGEMKYFPPYYVPGSGAVDMGQAPQRYELALSHERVEAPGVESQRAELYTPEMHHHLPAQYQGYQAQAQMWQQPLQPQPGWYPGGYPVGYPGNGDAGQQAPVEMPAQRYT